MISGHPTTPCRRLAALLLPALLLRAFIPVGFMPMAGAGGMSIILCPGAAALPPGLAPGGQSGHAPAHPGHTGGPHGGGPQEPGSAGHASCAFATGAGVLAAGLPAAAPTVPAASPPGEHASDASFVPAILRAQTPRAPPA